MIDQDNLLKWVEVSAAALRHNLAEFRRVSGGAALMAVVKSNAYGHGLEAVAAIAAAANADWLGVNELDEACRLRQAGHELPVLVLGAISPQRVDEAVEHELDCAVYDLAMAQGFAKAAERQGKRASLHIKYETGLNRQGVLAADLEALARSINDSPFLELAGLYTHFANIEDTTDHSYAQLQLTRFRQGLDKLEGAGMRPTVAHCACSAAAIVVPATSFDLIRVGIGMYGLWPSKETQLSAYMNEALPTVSLQPAMTWKTRIAQVKQVPRGAPIGYGCTERATHDLTMAILPIGYYDGYDRGLSNQGQVLIRGQRAYIRGRICMNMCMVDVTHIQTLQAGEEVVLLGRQGDETISAEFIAAQLGTINYEVVTRVAAHLPRVVID